MSQSLNPFHGATSPAIPSKLGFVPGTAARRDRLESAEIERTQRRDYEAAIHRHGLEMMEAQSNVILGQAAVSGVGMIVQTAIDVTANVGARADAAYRSASPVGQNMIENALGALAPIMNDVASSHAAALRRN